MTNPRITALARAYQPATQQTATPNLATCGTQTWAPGTRKLIGVAPVCMGKYR